MNDRKTVSYPVLMAILGLLTVFAACMGVRWGSAPLTFREMIQGLIHPDSGTVSARILWVVRLPRVAAAMLAGAGLAFSGLLLQSATNNPLAGPNIIGVNAGAGLAVAVGFVEQLIMPADQLAVAVTADGAGTLAVETQVFIQQVAICLANCLEPHGIVVILLNVFDLHQTHHIGLLCGMPSLP